MNNIKKEKPKKTPMGVLSFRVPMSVIEAYESMCEEELATMTKSKYFRLLIEHSKKTNFNLLSQR